MDGSRFDQLTRAMGTSVGRRQVVRGLVGGFGASLLASSVSAKPVKCYGAGSHCTNGKQCCSGVCTNRMCEDSTGGGTGGCAGDGDCPDDGNPCTAAVCDASTGQCAQVSVAQGTPCGENSFCVHFDSDYCLFCDSGQGFAICYCPFNIFDPACSAVADPTIQMFTACVDTINDPHNCGGCGNVCDASQTCQGGSCV